MLWKSKALFGSTVLAFVLSSCGHSPSAGDKADNPEWSILGAGSDQQYYSTNGRIDESNVGQMGLAWYAEMDTGGDGLVGNPLVADGVIYQGGPPGKIYANDLKTGKSLWTFTPEFEIAENTSWTGFWGMHFNRGLAMDSDNLYIGANCKMIAVSRKTHKQVWATQSCDASKQQSIVGAPRVGGGKVFIGNASADMGTDRGFIDAFDGKTGKHLWRFYTMPGDPSKPFESEIMAKAAKTWGTDYWKYVQGGVSPWDAITYDEKSDTLYFGTDGPSPWSPADRAPDAGDELFTDSIVAVNASTGAYKWHFQTVQHDGWNFAATMHIMLADLPNKDGKGVRRVVMTAPKNGFFYVLDAATGKFISGKNYVPVNWTKGLDKNGRPIPSDEIAYWKKNGQEVLMQPGDSGAHSWEAMAYNPNNGLIYIPVTRAAMTLKADKKGVGGTDADYYYGFRPDAKLKTYGELLAWDPRTQTEKWRVNRPISVNGGVLATAGNLLFQGTGDGKFEALSAVTGKKLWSFNAGGTILSAPTTVTVDGVQYILVASGNGGASSMRGIPRMMTNQKADGPPRLLAFRIGGKATLPIEQPKPFLSPAMPKPTAALAAEGRQVFNKYTCGACHGYNAQGLSRGIPDLRRMSPETAEAMRTIVIEGAYRSVGMPSFPKMTDKELIAVRAYIMKQSWDAYEAQQNGRSSDNTLSNTKK
jgi:PQQ-dependent dehydrogenase (methanol/ethanol family)